MKSCFRQLEIAASLVSLLAGLAVHIALLGIAAPAAALDPRDDGADLTTAQLAFLGDLQDPWNLTPEHAHPCVNGDAEGYPCDDVDLLAFLPLADIGGGSGNDLWGWTDPDTGKEYALMGRTSGTAFVDVSDPENPVYLGNLPTHSGNSTWRDIKVYGNYAVIVSEASDHGLQVFDLTLLRSVASPPETFTETAHYDGFGRAHNVALNEATGFAYAVGSTQGTTTCSGGLHMVDLADPLAPAFAGCFGDDGYTHDAQCVLYAGPDGEHLGKEICFNSNEDTLTIVDVTDKANPAQISRTSYSGRGYTHQGWLSDDHAHFLLDDELDEQSNGHNSRTYVWDVSDLDDPAVVGTYTGPSSAIDHNQYVRGEYVYQANYRSGLRILHLDDLAAGAMTEVAYFDIYPQNDSPSFNGAWSTYPFFDSGIVLLSGIEQGLYVLQPRLCTAPDAPVGLSAQAGGDNRIDLAWSGGAEPGAAFHVYRAFGPCPGGNFQLLAAGVAGTAFADDTASGSVSYAYRVTAADATGLCESAASACAEAVTSGECTAEPIFAGLERVSNPAGLGCALDLTWTAATPNCGGTVSYNVYRGAVPDFPPGPSSLLVSGVGATTFRDTELVGAREYHYAVRAQDADNGAEDTNAVILPGVATGPVADGTWTAGAEAGDPTLSFSSGASVGGPEDHRGWHLSTARAHTGSRGYFSGYENDMCAAVVTPALRLTAGESSTLSFWTVYDIESRWDGGVVEISTDGGGSWARLDLTPSYPDTFRSSSDACGYLSGDPAFSGRNLSWTEHSADLSAYNGSEVLIRWNFSTDGGLTVEGWYIDDIAVTHAEIPGACQPDLSIFDDGFESGDTSAW